MGDHGTAGTLIRTVRSGSTAEEDGRTGVVGTPAFMAPEQARGEAVDERADVFGLGAILCVTLTGQPPYAAARCEEVLRKAAAGDLAEALGRLDRCGADAELVALCKECLAPGREERPRDAGEVAARVAAHQAAVQERLRKAELGRAAAQARAEEAKATAADERTARRRTLALAAALLALVGVAAAGGLLVQHQAAERRAEQVRHEAQQGQAVEFALDKAAALRGQSRWAEAAAVLEHARRVLGETGPDDLPQRLRAAEDELALVSRLDAIRQRRATAGPGQFDQQTVRDEYAAAFKQTGLGEEGDAEEEVARRVRASAVAGPLVAALDDWVLVARRPELREWLLGVTRRADPDPWRDRFRDPALWRDRQALLALADEALRDGGARLGDLSPPQVLTLLGTFVLHSRGGAETAPLLRAGQRRYPDDFWLNLGLGIALHEAKQHGEAVSYCRVAVALRPAAAPTSTSATPCCI